MCRTMLTCCNAAGSIAPADLDTSATAYVEESNQGGAGIKTIQIGEVE